MVNKTMTHEEFNNILVPKWDHKGDRDYRIV